MNAENINRIRRYFPYAATSIPSQKSMNAAVFFIRLIAFVSSILGSSPAFSVDRIENRAYFLDHTNKLTLQEINSADLTPFDGALGLGFLKGTVWVRLQIGSSSLEQQARDGDLVLRISPSFLDSIELFDEAFPSAEPRLAGDLEAPNIDRLNTLAFSFKLRPGIETRYIWLKIHSTSTVMISASVTAVYEAEMLEKKLLFATTLYIALLVLVNGTCFIFWLCRGSELFLLFSLKQLVGIAFVVTTLGYVQLFLGDQLEPASIDRLTSISTFLFSILCVCFDSRFVRQYAPPKPIVALLYAGVPLTLIGMTLALSGYRSIGLTLNSIITLLEPCVCIFAIALSKTWRVNDESRPLIPRWFLLVFYSATLCSSSMATLPALGWTKPTPALVGSYMTYNLLSAVLVLVLLIMESKKNRIQLTLAQEKITTERKRRGNEKNFTALLAHELKNPLAVIRMAVATSMNRSPASQKNKMEHAVEEMAKLIDRCVSMSQLEDARLVVKKESFDLRKITEALIFKEADRQRINITGLQKALINSDPELIAIVVKNFIDNAIKYGASGEVIGINVSHQHRKAEGTLFEIENMPGPVGWPDPESVFKKYYRAKAASRYSGYGLGLYLIKGLVDLLEGEVIYSPAETRVRFELWLPN